MATAEEVAKEIKAHAQADNVEFDPHAVQRMAVREINRADVINALINLSDIRPSWPAHVSD